LRRGRQRRRLTDANPRLDEIVRRLERMQAKLDLHPEGLVRVEQRTSPLRPWFRIAFHFPAPAVLI